MINFFPQHGLQMTMSLAMRISSFFTSFIFIKVLTPTTACGIMNDSFLRLSIRKDLRHFPDLVLYVTNSVATY